MNRADVCLGGFLPGNSVCHEEVCSSPRPGSSNNPTPQLHSPQSGGQGKARQNCNKNPHHTPSLNGQNLYFSGRLRRNMCKNKRLQQFIRNVLKGFQNGLPWWLSYCYTFFMHRLFRDAFKVENCRNVSSCKTRVALSWVCRSMATPAAASKREGASQKRPVLIRTL